MNLSSALSSSTAPACQGGWWVDKWWSPQGSLLAALVLHHTGTPAQQGGLRGKGQAAPSCLPARSHACSPGQPPLAAHCKVRPTRCSMTSPPAQLTSALPAPPVYPSSCPAQAMTPPVTHLKAQLPPVLSQRGQQAQVALQEGQVPGRHLLGWLGLRALHDALGLRVLQLVPRSAGWAPVNVQVSHRCCVQIKSAVQVPAPGHRPQEGRAAQTTQLPAAGCLDGCRQEPWPAAAPATASRVHLMSVRPNQVSRTSKVSASRVHSTLTA